MLYFIFRQPEAVAYKCDKLGIGGLVAVKAYLTVKLVLNELAVSVLPVPCGGYGMAYGSLHTGGCGLIGLGNVFVMLSRTVISSVASITAERRYL